MTAHMGIAILVNTVFIQLTGKSVFTEDTKKTSSARTEKGEPMSDLIDRQALIESLYRSFVDAQEWAWSTNDPDIKPRAESAVATFMEAILRVKQMPSIPQWIPVSKRMPEEGQEVIVCMRNIFGDVTCHATKLKDITYWAGLGRCPNIIAWMPLPEPWKGEEDG